MLATSMSTRQYRVVVEGELGARYASAFEGMAICAHDGITEITGPLIDPSHIHALIDRICDLGLTLLSLAPLNADNAQAATHEPTETQPDGR
jgi:hypothetical protein